MSIVVFAYAFPHQKSRQFLIELKLLGFTDVTVLGASWKNLEHPSKFTYLKKPSVNITIEDTANICQHLGFAFYECEHDDERKIRDIIFNKEKVLGIISGARIIKSNIISLFDEGVVNLHPGMLPETAGLDSFFYSIKKNIELGVTTHFINKLIDAGERIDYHPLILQADDTIDDISRNLQILQIRALRCFLKTYVDGSIVTEKIIRPIKNEPMPVGQKIKMLERFEAWKFSIVNRQVGDQLIEKCAYSTISEVEEILHDNLHLLNYQNELGWSPLSSASYHQNIDIVKLLLDTGANPNMSNHNGTTVLMNAKTKILDDLEPDFKLLNMLIDAGSKILVTDNKGKTVIDYSGNNPKLQSFLKERSEHEAC